MSHDEAAAIAQEIRLADPLQRRLNEQRIKDRAEELATIEAHLSIFEHYGAADVCQSRRCAGET